MKKNTMKIHLQSDTHVEIGPTITPAVASNLTICAGDIGLIANLDRLKRYFDSIKETTENIIWVLGNHEFYHYDYHLGLEHAAKFADDHDIYLMDEALGTDNLEIDGVKFWGSTLWTDLKESDWFVMRKIGHGMNDFHIIKNGNRGFTAHDTVEINRRTREKINWDADVVITHHCPMVVQHRRFPINDITYGFCNTGLENQIAQSNIKYWIYGHTHDSRSLDVNGTQVISNQHGYTKYIWQTGEIATEEAHYDPHLILEI